MGRAQQTRPLDLRRGIRHHSSSRSMDEQEGQVIESTDMNKQSSLLIKDTTREERERIVHQALWGNCGIDCEFCSGCDNRGGGRIEGIYQDYIDGKKEIREINAEYRAPFVRG